ncbi:MAG: DUF1801 domain-containing protein [Alphaproteobacteria bacterium]
MPATTQPLANQPKDPGITAVFNSYPSDVRARLLGLRRQILETAATTKGCGEIEETLKWGQPSYLTARPKSGTTIRLGAPKGAAGRSGTTIRLGAPKGAAGRYGFYVHCQTSLVDFYREIYPVEFDYEGARGVIMQADRHYDEAAIRHCIALALMYHQNKRTPAG